MKIIFKILILSLVLVSCDQGNNGNSKNYTLGNSTLNAFTASDNIVVNEDVKKQVNQESTTRKLIKNGTISFATENLKQSKNNILTLVKQYGGYVSSDTQNNYGDRQSINLRVRIPAQNFDTILSGISKNVKKFDNKDISISDVTEQFLDLETRLKNKKELEKKYLDILKKAVSVKDILQVEKEIGKLREDIEAAEGRLNYLQNQVNFSTLNISFYKTIENSSTFGKKLKDGFLNGFENLKIFFVGIINIWPFVIIFSVILLFIKRRFKKKKR